MKIVDAMPGRQNYPWTEWFDGQTRLLEPGADFTCEPEGMRTAAYAAAKKAGFKVVVRIRDEGVYLQRVTKEADQDGDDSRRQVA